MADLGPEAVLETMKRSMELNVPGALTRAALAENEGVLIIDKGVKWVKFDVEGAHFAVYWGGTRHPWWTTLEHLQDTELVEQAGKHGRFANAFHRLPRCAVGMMAIYKELGYTEVAKSEAQLKAALKARCKEDFARDSHGNERVQHKPLGPKTRTLNASELPTFRRTFGDGRREIQAPHAAAV